MNRSPSAQSVGSLKPSTAASTASGKRTRTIIVARNLSSDTRAAPLNVSMPSPSNRRHVGGSREAKLTKLSSYAALGSEADVELYERYLAETARASQSDLTQTTEGNASPAFLKGSPKRRTMGHLFNQGDSGTTGGSDQARESAQLEDVAADAKQRRDALVQHRKWLKSLPIHERLAYERQQNAIKRWKAVTRQWEDFKQRTSKKLGKSEKQLVMSRASEYREQIEMYDALQRATPLSEKVAGDFWLVSLRNEGTRYVPVGNIFSGLYCPIRESSKLQPRVRRPLDYLDTNERDDPDIRVHGKVLSNIEKRSLEVLERKKRRLKKQLEALYPHEVEPSHSGQLRVDTMDLFEWASKGRNSNESSMRPSQQTLSTRSLLLPLEENDQENIGDGIHSPRSTGRSRGSARRKGPSLVVFSPDAHEEPTDSQVQLRQQHVDLTFVVDIGSVQHNQIHLENNGTTALQFLWRRQHLVQDELTHRLTHDDPSPLSKPERIAWTSISQREGVVLPNEVLTFVFSFQSQHAGIWLEQWVLDVDPPVPGLTPGEPAAIVRLQATAVDNFVPVSQRRKVGAVSQKEETKFASEQILKHDIIGHVDPQYAIEFVELSHEAQVFYDTHRRGEYNSVQYGEGLIKQCHALYADALAVLSTQAEPIVVGERADENEAESLPTPPKEWDLNLSTLKDLAIAADGILFAQYTALKTQILAERGNHDEDEDEDEDDIVERVLCTKARKKATQEAALRALEPHFINDLESVTLSANISPYEPRLLTETMTSKLAAMASEAAVVVEIAHMMSTETQTHEATDLLRPLLVRALDESLDVDRQRERLFEDAKRHFHNVQLDKKTDFTSLSRLIADSASHSGEAVIFLQVDLDIANWYTLASEDPNAPLEWKLAPKLLDHESYVPPKLTTASASVQTVLQTLVTNGQVPTIVLLSELSTPPMTKAMKRMETEAARAAIAATTSVADGTPPAVPTAIEIETWRQTLAIARDKHLSLRGLEILLQRALTAMDTFSPAVEFVGSLQELETMCRPPAPRPTTPENSGTELETPLARAEEQTLPIQLRPRILLLEHLGVLTTQALKKPQESARPNTDPPPVTSTPTPDKGKPSAVNDKKKSSVPPPTTPAPKVPTPRPEGDDSDTIDLLPGMSLEMMATQALGQRLAMISRFLVVDFFPQSWWEATFVYFAIPSSAAPPPLEGEEEAVEVVQPTHLVVGPQLAQTLAYWGSLFQPTPIGEERIVPMRAIVGGRGLERKLRLIDGLLQRVSTIYFAGELATTIYRILYTKQLIKSVQRERKPVPQFEMQRYITAVERIMQKAYRKQVDLLLPFDFVVGESPLDGESGPSADEDGDDEEDLEEEEEEEDDDDDEVEARKKKAKKIVTPQKPLEEPVEVDTWQLRPSYDGERGMIQLKPEHWVRFADVTLETISKPNVVAGNGTLLGNSEGEEEDTQSSFSPSIQGVPELDWMTRIFDIGPKSTQVLLDDLHILRDAHRGYLFLNGTLGAVEYRDFAVATQGLVVFLQTSQGVEGVQVAGKTTCRWVELLGSRDPNRSARVVSSHTRKLATVLTHIVESRPHAMLTAIDSA